MTCVLHRNVKKYVGDLVSSLWATVYRAHGENDFVISVFSKCCTVHKDTLYYTALKIHVSVCKVCTLLTPTFAFHTQTHVHTFTHLMQLKLLSSYQTWSSLLAMHSSHLWTSLGGQSSCSSTRYKRTRTYQ